MLKKAFARGFERLYHSLNRKKICSRLLANDQFDGKTYTVDAFYERCRPYFDSPCEFYIEPPPADQLGLREGMHPRETVRDGLSMRRMLFHTPIKSGWEENDLVPLKWFTGSAKSKAFLLFVPGWGRSSQGFEEEMCRRWADRGIDAGLITKPYHQARAPLGSYTGEYFISANMFWTIANFRQCVAEIRAVLRYMRPRYEALGLFEMSSGGFQAGLAANCEDLEFYFPFITGCQLGSITWHGLITQYVRRDLERMGVDESALNKVWSMTDLLILGRHCRARDIRHYVATFDSVVRTRYQEKLWEVYGRQSRLDLESSHYSSYFYRNFIADDVATFMRDRL